MKNVIPNEFAQPSDHVINFLKAFARNYRVVTLPNGESMEVILS